jgi:hypothetical protein
MARAYSFDLRERVVSGLRRIDRRSPELLLDPDRRRVSFGRGDDRAI